MNTPEAERDRQARDIFLRALDKMTPEARSAFLDGACGVDVSLRSRVEALLANHLQDSFLEEGVATVLSDERSRANPVTESPGTVIDRYRLLEKLGEGGFGVVYVAEQREPVKRRVALKIIKLGMDTQQVVARFEAERQALALMDHPNIAKVLDAGATETGRPYFVMELVRGIPMTKYCDENNLAMEERLKLFTQVCHAIQHAHQKGIIHRDIKPSNILVTLHDGVPVPKVIDFGIAKATQGHLTEKTIYTQFQQFIGTPAYMSPEQAEMSGLDIDTRSDIYSLGVLLYELLVGKTPFDGKELLLSGLDEMRRTLREKEPPKPSTRLSSMLEEEQTTTAKRRGADAPRLISLLRGDLDWIAMKALEKDRARRYETANGLAMDIKRFLNQQPVEARPPSAAYRFQKLVRRNKLAFAAAASVAAALVFGIVASTWQARRATRAERTQRGLRQEADQQRNIAVAAHTGEVKQRRLAEQTARDLRRHAYVADMNNAHQAVKEGNWGKAATLVERYRRSAPGEEDLRGFEWRYLWQLCQPSEHYRFQSDWPRLDCAVFSPHGKTLAVGGYDTNVTVLDVASRNVLAKLGGFDGFIDLLGLTFSPDGRFLAAKGGHVIRVWGTDNWRELFHWTNGNPNWNNNNAVVISPDSTTLATRITNGIGFWDLNTGHPFYDRTIEGHPPFGIVMNFGTVMAYSRDGEMLAISDWDELQLRGAHSLSIITNLTGPRNINRVLSVAFSTNLLAAGYREGELKLWELNNWREVGSFKAHSSFLRALSFSPDGTLLATGGSDSVIYIWKVASLLENGPNSQANSPYATLKGHARGVSSVVFSPDGQTLASSSWDGTARLWSVRPMSETTVLAGSDGVLWFSSDGKQVITADRDGKLYRRGIPADLDSRPIDLPVIDKHCSAISSDGRTLASRTSSGTIELWNLDTGTLISAIQTEDKPEQIKFTPDGRLLISSHERGGIRIRDLTTRKKEVVLDHLGYGFAISPDGRMLAAHRLDLDGIVLWSIAEDRQLDLLRIKTAESSPIAFSSDGKLLAAMSDQKAAVAALLLYDVASRRITEIPVKERSSIWNMAFAPDGKTLVLGTTDNDVLFWNVATREEILREMNNRHGGDAPRFSPNGEWLAARGKPLPSGEAPFVLWHAPSLAEIDAEDQANVRVNSAREKEDAK